jgi:CheY-like chemotaxis protein
VLVMDDEEIVREVAMEILVHLGYRADLCGSGTEAVKLCREAMNSEDPYAVVIMDLTVPGGMGGKETIKKLLEIDASVKGIVSSGYSEDPHSPITQNMDSAELSRSPIGRTNCMRQSNRWCRNDTDRPGIKSHSLTGWLFFLSVDILTGSQKVAGMTINCLSGVFASPSYFRSESSTIFQ